MFEIIAIVAIVLAIAIAVVLILAATKPNTLTVQRAISGKGAVYGWEGNKNVGSGRMEILDAAAPSKIVIKLDFFTPFEGHNTAEFTMLPQGDATNATTNVAWLMHGTSPFIGKIMQVFINMDRMIGKDFEAGLANLKRLTEK